jgi:predicted GIY-YIG superfamily endonuclease
MEKNENESWYVYILMCSNRNIYTGITKNLLDRLKRHNSGKVKSTARILPVELITCVVFNK